MRLIFVMLIGTLLTACASKGNTVDPYESFNRKVYSFNRAIDKAVIKPVAEGYKAVTPDPVEAGVDNFFSNLGDIGNFVNNLLQFKVTGATSDLGRFLINSTLGLGGLFDPASAMGLEKHDEDFGQTLATWGVEPGPYLMLPFLGPSTLRDTASMPADNYFDPVSYLEDDSAQYSLKGIRLLVKRAELLELEQQIENALDEYSFIRDAYLQNRKYKVYDGDLPFEDDFGCDPEYEEC
ncbi:MlaA family lipoprotein [Pleionea mediterranea]|uniref:Phospholipid-binding lipoprotein MlaA n=1 Tax=Pleionea mediterranea TaxID=523701 RepID=A0A316FM55_9GAMM|nr:VacJ family lipoprotein [Pleionea mediterranea]PWK49961.1 phospholipid-binding lipoprotein MlaA [Pleionea mediterranea]